MNRKQTWNYWYQEIKELPKVNLQSVAEKDQLLKLQQSAICFFSLKPKD